MLPALLLVHAVAHPQAGCADCGCCLHRWLQSLGCVKACCLPLPHCPKGLRVHSKCGRRQAGLVVSVSAPTLIFSQRGRQGKEPTQGIAIDNVEKCLSNKECGPRLQPTCCAESDITVELQFGPERHSTPGACSHGQGIHRQRPAGSSQLQQLPYIPAGDTLWAQTTPGHS